MSPLVDEAGVSRSMAFCGRISLDESRLADGNEAVPDVWFAECGEHAYGGAHRGCRHEAEDDLAAHKTSVHGPSGVR
jgi:hypothetical protein